MSQSTQEKYDEQRRKDNEEYERVKRMIEQTRLSCQKTMDSCDSSLKSLSVTMTSVAKTRKSFDDFQEQYSQVMKKLGEKLAQSIGSTIPLFKKKESNSGYEDSKPTSIQECTMILKDKKKIAILTGAGISVASGIPSFRGIGAADLFEKDGITYKNEEIATVEFMRCKPQIFWERQIQFIEGMKGKQENVSHRAIQELINYFRQQDNESPNKKEVLLVTQNIDGLHNMAIQKFNNQKQFEPQPYYFEIHGNKNYLRCNNSKCSQFNIPFLLPQQYKNFTDFVCPKCEQLARPNVLYFDESYNELHYRTDTLKEELKNIDALICIGTMLETAFAAIMVSDAIKLKIPIIEINLTPVIEVGGLIFKSKAEDVVPQLCYSLIGKKEGEKVVKQVEPQQKEEQKQNFVSQPKRNSLNGVKQISPPKEEGKKPANEQPKRNSLTGIKNPVDPKKVAGQDKGKPLNKIPSSNKK